MQVERARRLSAFSLPAHARYDADAGSRTVCCRAVPHALLPLDDLLAITPEFINVGCFQVGPESLSTPLWDS